MRRINHIICFCIAFGSFTVLAQNPKKAIKNSLIPEKFTIAYDINLKDTINPGFMQNIPGQNLNEIILERIFNGEVAPFEYNAESTLIKDTISIDQAKIKLGGGTKEVYLENVMTGEQEIKKITLSVNLEEIIKYRFIEEWSFDEKDYIFRKNIIAYCPIRKYYRDEDPDMQNPLFRIAFAILNNKKGQLKPNKADKWTLITKAVYEVPFENKSSLKDSITRSILGGLTEEGYTLIENENCPDLNLITRKNLAMLLYNHALDQNTVVFDMNGFYKKKNEIKFSSGETEKNIEVYDEMGNIEVKKIKYEFNPIEIKALLFFEDWYINEATLQFDKRITAIAPIRYYSMDDAESYERKTIPFILYANSEDKDRLEKLYYKLIFNGYNALIIDHIEMFNLLAKQSKSPDFKAFCTQKQNDLMAYLLKNNITGEERVNLFLLSEKLKLGYTADKLTSLPVKDLESLFVVLTNYSDTCKNDKEQLQYFQLSKTIGEKIVQKEDNCENRLNLLKIYEKLNLKDEISKYQNSDKPWLSECVANYYLNSKDSELKNVGVSMFKKIYKDSINCKIAMTYYNMHKELRDKNLNIDKFITTQNEAELRCFADFLENKYYASKDSLEKLEIMKTSEKLFTQLIERTAIADYYLGLYRAETVLGKPIDIKLLDRLIDTKDLLPILNQIFYLIVSDSNVSINNLQLCKPYFEKLIASDISESELWSFTFYMIRWKKWTDEKKSKSLSTYIDMLLTKMLSFDPNLYTYLFCKYELDLEQGKNPDINNMLNQTNQKNLEIFAKFFGTGFNEYIFIKRDTDSDGYLENYLINATKFYEKLIKLQPNNEEYKHNCAEVYYKLTFHYLIKNQNLKATESASMIKKIEPANDYAVIATILCYLLDGKESKVYKLSDSYISKQRASKVSYIEFFKYEANSLLDYKKDCEALKKYLEYLKK